MRSEGAWGSSGGAQGEHVRAQYTGAWIVCFTSHSLFWELTIFRQIIQSQVFSSRRRQDVILIGLLQLPLYNFLRGWFC